MPENQERYYNISRLNKIFAFVSILLLLSLLVLFRDDYSRDWKKYQQQFTALEIEKTRAKLAEEQGKLKSKPEYLQLLQKLDSLKKQSTTQSTQLREAQKSLAKLNVRCDLDKQNYQFAKAEYDAAKYEYEDAQAHKPSHLAAAKSKLEKIDAKLKQLHANFENSTNEVKQLTTEIQKQDNSLRETEKEIATASRQSTLLERKLRSIDPKEMSLANKLASLIRNLPVLDFMNPSYKIQQTVVQDITDDVNFMRVPKVDRCMTCHLGVLNPDYKDAPQPFTTHPNLELFLSSKSMHPVEEFACTSCHGGRGRGTDFTSAVHTPSSKEQAEEWEKKHHWHKFHYWETPMYPKQYTQAGCFKCHSTETTLQDADKLNLGLNLIEKAACFSCHTIDKYKNWPKVGPDLKHIAKKLPKDWTYRWIKDPKSFRHDTWMPSFFAQSNTSDEVSRKRTDQEIHAIVALLYKRSADFSVKEVPVIGNKVNGEKLVASLGCFGCHTIESKEIIQPTTLQSLRREHGPSLTGLGTKTSGQWLYNWLKDPSRYHPQTRMPNLRLSDQEASDIAAYLSMDSKAEFAKNSIPPIDETILNEIVNGFLIKSTTVANAKQELAKMTKEEKLEYAGEKLIRHYGCFACHNISGFENEKPIGTELTEEGSKSAHKLDFGFVDIEHDAHVWFAQKLKDPRIFDQGKVKAPDEKLKMPNFHFSDQEIEAITTAILGFVKDKPAPSKLRPNTPENVFIDEGEQLVREFNCQGCHLVRSSGAAIQSTIEDWLVKFEGKSEADAQALATSFSPPNLVGEGKKVQAAWLFNFIHNPETIRPWLAVRMPTFDLTEEQINAFVRYFNYLDKQDFPFTESAASHMTQEEIKAAETLFSKNYFDCTTCHIVGSQLPSGSPDRWAPNFALAQKRLKPEWMIEWLKNPQELLPGTKMPTYFDPAYFDSTGPDDVLEGDENKQIRVLRDYILTFSDKPSGNKENLPAPEPAVIQPPAAPNQ